eukprot:COSAG01_NODE_28695_length_655_cov_0.890288_3_plen_114_part_01
MSRPSHQITYLETQRDPQSSMASRAPPIPRRGSASGEVVADNVMRARQQVLARRNRARAPVARRTGALLNRAEQDRIEQSAEDRFMAGNVRQAVASATFFKQKTAYEILRSDWS